MQRKIGLLYELSHCKGMIESILCYHWSEGMTAKDFIDDSYLADIKETIRINRNKAMVVDNSAMIMTYYHIGTIIKKRNILCWEQ